MNILKNRTIVILNFFPPQKILLYNFKYTLVVRSYTISDTHLYHWGYTL